MNASVCEGRAYCLNEGEGEHVYTVGILQNWVVIWNLKKLSEMWLEFSNTSLLDFDGENEMSTWKICSRHFEWHFASVWIDLSSSRNRHVSSIRLWFSSLVTTDHSNIVSFYNNLLLSKRSLFYSFSSSECLMILTSIIEKIGMRLSTCDHQVLLLEFYAVLLVFIRRLKNEM